MCIYSNLSRRYICIHLFASQSNTFQLINSQDLLYSKIMLFEHLKIKYTRRYIHSVYCGIHKYTYIFEIMNFCSNFHRK